MAFILTIIYIIFTHHTTSLTQTTTLNATHETISGVSITRNPENVDTSNNIYHINPTSQKSYDLLLTLTNTWTFNPSIPSELQFTLNGFTPPQSTQDGEFMMIFSINNTQYFSVVIRLDLQKNTWKYYPQTTNSNNFMFATTNDVYQDIIRGLQDNGTDSRVRWQRVSNNDQWADIIPYYKSPLIWPFTIKLINDPIQNAFLYQCILSDTTTLQFNYFSALLGDADIDIYIMNDADDNKPFDIYSIKVAYTDNSSSDPVDIIESTYDNTEEDIGATSVMPTDTTTTTAAATADTASTDGQGTTMYDTKIMAYDPQSVAGDGNGDLSVGAIIGIVLGCLVCLNVVIIGGYWLFKRRSERVNDPSGVNKSEYHRPDVETMEIDEVLNRKRKESMMMGYKHDDYDIDEDGRTPRGVIPIRSHESDEEEDYMNE